MENNQPRIRSLLRQAARVEEAGKRAAAEQLYRQIIEEAPQTETAWLGLARLAAAPADQEAAYSRVLELDPENKEAKIALAEMRGEFIPSAWRATPKPKPKPKPKAPAKKPEVTAVPAEDDSEHYEFVCYRHSERGTSLRCYNCSNPICVSCANKTSVGYLCPDCFREMENKFFNARPVDYLIATLVAFPLSLIAGFLVTRLGAGFFFIFLMIFVGGFVGGLIGRLTKRAIGGRRGRYLPYLVVAMMVLGVIIPSLPLLVFLLSGGGFAVMGLIAPAVYLFVAGTSAFYWMK